MHQAVQTADPLLLKHGPDSLKQMLTDADLPRKCKGLGAKASLPIGLHLIHDESCEE